MTLRISHVVRVAMTSALLVLVIGVPASEAGKRHPKCFGRVATIVTDKPTITGTSHTDVIVATGTRGDTIRAMGGNDYVCSGLGNDIVDGGKGDDKIDGGPGDDGGRRCLDPSFVLNGGPGDDKIRGGDGTDCLTGRAGDDVLGGGPGDDFLVGGPAKDRLNGGIEGSFGDTASFGGLSSPVTANLDAGVARSRAGRDDMDDIENLVGTRFGDRLIGSSGAASVDFISGELGDDVIDGNGGRISYVSYFLTDGPETVNLGAGTASGPDGNDTLIEITAVDGSQFPDTITGGDGDDLIVGQAGDDTLDGGGGTDSGDGGPGIDTCTNFETGPSGGTAADNCEA